MHKVDVFEGNIRIYTFLHNYINKQQNKNKYLYHCQEKFSKYTDAEFMMADTLLHFNFICNIENLRLFLHFTLFDIYFQLLKNIIIF